MDKQYYFISGLPRSGSTLLSAILLQNPDFYSDISSPLSSLITSSIENLTLSESNFNIGEERREKILHGIVDSFYGFVDKPVVFDTSREWTSKTSLLKRMFPYTKILCCVRDVRWILDSFERISAHNPYYLNLLFDKEDRTLVDQRCKSLMDVNKNGVIIRSWKWLEEGLAINPNMIYIVDYDDLCKEPEKIMKEIYQFIDKPYYHHDFNSVEYKNELFDTSVNMMDMHTVRKKVEWLERKPILPQSVWDYYSLKPFWKKDKFNYR